MFKIYDLNFREISLPSDNVGYGLRGLDLFISSIGRRVTAEDIPGLPGTNRTHEVDDKRTADIRALIVSSNKHDYRLKRNRVYSFFRQLGHFYIAESHEPNKIWELRQKIIAFILSTHYIKSVALHVCKLFNVFRPSLFRVAEGIFMRKNHPTTNVERRFNLLIIWIH